MNLRSFKTQQNKQKGISVISEHDQALGPQPHNAHAPYFPDAERIFCTQVVLRILTQFRIKQIEYLVTELADGKVNGAFAATDLIATLTMIPRNNPSARRVAREKIYRTKLFRQGTRANRDKRRSAFEYWTRQIGGIGVDESHPLHHEQRKQMKGSISDNFRQSISAAVKSGQLSVLGGVPETRKARCLFTEETIKWCLLILDQKKRKREKRMKKRELELRRKKKLNKLRKKNLRK